MHVAPACAGSGEGSDHLVLLYGKQPLLAFLQEAVSRILIACMRKVISELRQKGRNMRVLLVCIIVLILNVFCHMASASRGMGERVTTLNTYIKS